MPSTNALRQVAQHNNASTNRLSTPLPALDENHVLEPVQPQSTQAAAPQGEPSRLTKFKSAVQTRVPFWGGKKQEQLSDDHVPPALQADNYSVDYTSDMVDVLDTIGT